MRFNHIVALLAAVACLELASSAEAATVSGGACCLPDDSCIDDVTEDDCTIILGGVYESDDSLCGGIEACCDHTFRCVLYGRSHLLSGQR